MPLEGFHLAVARIIAETLGDRGFALGGGYGLQAHGIVDRPSQDLDSYPDKMDAGLFEAAGRDLTERFGAAGLAAETIKTDTWFRAIVVTEPTTKERLVVDLGYDYRQNPPVHVNGVGPVLDVEDIVTGKVRAFWTRGAERDFYDIDGILASDKWTIQNLYDKIAGLRPDEICSGVLSKKSFAAKLSSGHRLDPDEFAALGISLPDLRKVQGRLSNAGAALAREDVAFRPRERSIVSRAREWKARRRPQARAKPRSRSARVASPLPSIRCGGRAKARRPCILRAGHRGYHRGR